MEDTQDGRHDDDTLVRGAACDSCLRYGIRAYGWAPLLQARATYWPYKARLIGHALTLRQMSGFVLYQGQLEFIHVQTIDSPPHLLVLPMKTTHNCSFYHSIDFLTPIVV